MEARELQASLKGTQYRSTEASIVEHDSEKRTVTLSFSSESEVERWFGIEILDHSDESSVSLERLNRSGPLLLDHTVRDQIGKVERAWLDREKKKCRAVVRFSRNQRADEVFNDVIDGIRDGISVGYSINELDLVEKRGEKNVYRATRWEPLEISLTAVPADINVGIGRSIELSEEKGARMSGRDIVGAEKYSEKTDDTGAERRRSTEILSIGAKFGYQDEAQKAVIDGTSVEEFRMKVLDKVSSKNVEEKTSMANVLGISAREVRDFSICRAIAAAVAENWDLAPYERDVSQEIASKRGQALSRGFYVPTEMLTRSANVTTGTSGGFIASEYRPSEFIELLTERSIIRTMGATFLSGLVGNLAIPRQTEAGDAYWIEEEGEPEQAKLKIDQVSMSPKTLGAFYDLTRRTVLQTSPSIEQFVRGELARIMALKIDRTVLFGSGTDKGFAGIMNRPGLKVAKSKPENDPFNFNCICELESLISGSNADIGSMGYLTNTYGRYMLRQVKEQQSSVTGLWQSLGNSTEGSLLGYPARVANVLANGKYGRPDGQFVPLLMGVWNQIVIGEWGVMSITADPYSLSKSGGLRLVVHYDLDLMIRHIESFAVAFAPAPAGTNLTDEPNNFMPTNPNKPVTRPNVDKKHES